MNETMPVECPAPASEASPLHRPCILFAEDEPSLRVCLTKHLRQAGYEVIAAEDGEQAWIALQASSYDLLLTDNQMPGIGGAEPGNGYLSAADGALPGAVCFSGASGVDCPCIGAACSPGNGNRCDAGASEAGTGVSHGAVGDFAFCPFLPSEAP